MKEWMLPVFIVVVWIVQAILRNREKEEPVRTPRNKSGGGPSDRSAGSEIDKFLQEIERMKKKSAEDKPEPPKVSRPQPPKVRPVNAQPPRARPAPQRIKLQPAAADAIPMIAIERSLTSSPARLPIGPPVVRSGRSPAMIGALSLLRTAQSTASAVILNEILGPPKCKRR